MRANLLRHRFKLEQDTPTRDTFGAEVSVWAELATVWGQYKPITGVEGFNSSGAQELAEATAQIIIRYRSDITPLMRVNWTTRSKIFDILAIADEDGRKRKTILTVKEQP